MITSNDNSKPRAKRNKTLVLNDTERHLYKANLLRPDQLLNTRLEELANRTICGNTLDVIKNLPDGIANLIILDPPYNLDKDFHGYKFKSTDQNNYLEYLHSWFTDVLRLLKDDGSLYLCGDWKSTGALQQILEKHLTILNRITWQREKGRGALRNWKNGMEDIWFAVKNKNDYYFNVDAVKQKRKVIAPYRENGEPKDWEETEHGNFRITYPSNFWDDISVPYWSMPENTDHPTQKPEKLIAKLILASCPTNGLVLDPFLGSGTSSVVAKKLGRNYLGIEMNEDYCLWAEKRLAKADTDISIQGYVGGVFWERNTLAIQQKTKKRTKDPNRLEIATLFDKEC